MGSETRLVNGLLDAGPATTETTVVSRSLVDVQELMADGSGGLVRSLIPQPSILNPPASPEVSFMVEPQDLVVKTLGPCRIDSPLMPLLNGRRPSFHNVDET